MTSWCIDLDGSAALRAEIANASPVAHRWDQPDSARALAAKTPAADVPAPPFQHRTCTVAASVAPQAAPISALHTSLPWRGPDPYGRQGADESQPSQARMP